MQALTPRERHPRFLIARPSGPLSRHGKGGGGKVGVPSGSQDPMGRGGRTAAGRAARSVTEGQHDSSGGCARRAPVATLGAILCAVRIEFRLPPKFNPYPALQATGVLGQSPKRVLVPFTRVKGTPRRRAVLTWLCERLSPPEVTANFLMRPAGQPYRL